MTILHISTYDTGGAAKSCIRLHEGLLRQGIDSKLLLLKKTNNSIPNSFQHNNLLLPKDEILKNKIIRILTEFKLHNGNSKYDKLKSIAHQAKDYELVTPSQTPYRIHLEELCNNADIINLHWTAGLLDYPSFFQHIKKPIIWTLHDMHPFTGGCHYSGNCVGYQHDCGNCPLFAHTENKNFPQQNLAVKLNSLTDFKNLRIVSPSKWLLNLSQKSSLFNRFQHFHIPYSLNENTFQPRDKHFARSLFNLPSQKTILLFVAEQINNQRKGIHFLQQAVAQLTNKEEFAICSVGSGNIDFEGVEYHNLGTIQDELLMSIVYSAADAFVIPSLEDNLPNTVIESLMCGTPVIGFRSGGIAEMIENQQNGLLVENQSANDLAEAIQLFQTLKETFNQLFIRISAEKKYSLHIQAKNYIKLYGRHTSLRGEATSERVFNE